MYLMGSDKMLYTVARWLFGLFFMIFYRWKCIDLKDIPSKGSFIVCSNHTSNLDPPLVGNIFPRKKIHFMAKEELFKNFLVGRSLRAVGAFPVKRGSVDKRSISHALELLKNGQVVGLFPEGTRVKTEKLGEIFHGPAYLALKSNTPVLPVAIKWPKKIFQPVKVSVGSLIYFTEEGKINKKVLENASSKLLEEMTKLWSSL